MTAHSPYLDLPLRSEAQALAEQAAAEAARLWAARNAIWNDYLAADRRYRDAERVAADLARQAAVAAAGPDAAP